MKRIAILGSTGSIGTQALDVVRAFPQQFCVVALAAGENAGMLSAQLREFSPEYAYVANGKALAGYDFSGLRTLFFTGPEALSELLSRAEADLILVAIPGLASLIPTFHALAHTKRLALASKEALVAGGSLLMQEAARCGTTIFPVDSELTALADLMQGRRPDEVSRLILTASGGPFRKMNSEEIRKVSPERAICHPVWRMGPKISVDSATMLNKALEILAASTLFDIEVGRIDTLVQAQARIHAMLDLCDGTRLAHLARPDMKTVIARALSWPERLPFHGEDMENTSHSTPWEFESPPEHPWFGWQLAYEVGDRPGLRVVLCAADEEAISAFLRGELEFSQIVPMVREVLVRARIGGVWPKPSKPEDFAVLENAARELARSVLSGFSRRRGEEKN